MVQEITAYKDSEGRIFATKVEAAQAEATLQLTDIIGNLGIAKQIVEKRAMIVNLLKDICDAE